MLKISNLKVNLSENNKEIVSDFSLNINKGEVHLLTGNNGSGKSSLVNALMGNPIYSITKGKIELENEEYSEFILGKVDNEFVKDNAILLNELEAFDRSLLGLFLANQYPVEIPGVSLTSYLRMIYNARLPKEEQLPVFKFKKLLEQKAEIINYPTKLLSRNLNEGFSGGEKKKTEILQMLILNPRYIMLDEIDSGLDKNAVKEVFEGLKTFKNLNPESSFIIITHYDKVNEYLKADFVHEMSLGKLNT